MTVSTSGGVAALTETPLAFPRDLGLFLVHRDHFDFGGVHEQIEFSATLRA